MALEFHDHDLPTHGPIISGGQERYRIGDVIQLNCTSPGTVPPPQLTWYIEGERLAADSARPVVSSTGQLREPPSTDDNPNRTTPLGPAIKRLWSNGN
ncbi:hypothetical protein FJT64_008254 [Amphibalanus amphitrite]|uniref:Ig-like domain-containing protein n=1 Tax=Amphibalanus amphitrite TaxID=1232801 RepID=A0A6A4VXB1_AMPAM|nr:hypothetical protein FJT64_008254 [Amphibalanus amphitrite]